MPRARRLGWPAGVPVAASVRLPAEAPVAVAVATKIGPKRARLRAQTGTVVVASNTPVYEPR